MPTIAKYDELSRAAECYALDAQGRVVSITNMEGQITTINYLIGPLVASVTRFDGSVVTNVYDSSANLASRYILGAPQLDAHMTYRANGQALAISNATSAISYAYDAYGRVVSETSATPNLSPVTINHSYLPGGHVCAGGGNTYKYDATGRLARMTSPAGTFSWTYDPLARKTVMTGPAHTTEYALDAQYNVNTITYGRKSGGLQMARFAYPQRTNDGKAYSKDRVTGAGINQTNDRVIHGYDALGRLTGEYD